MSATALRMRRCAAAGFDWNSKTNRLAFTEQAGLLPVLGRNLKF
ncbi:MAG: hypothetical protein ACK5Z1_05605 [Gemmatimonadota bacterium]